ncbi:MAG: 23S rRNA (adenine(2503)-C(2))-methyltransferase RlmN [Firmicutes bacterium HGW-Firmicutes-14]|jgi:23S rRNA (adenine2503-C2)-methyltransferase|nr:MAG: 23S rRNA (adenine(2503)-C(2))-methyltransferase RlmN [Firmicutes bacterium HGW-Firmicutes-14]
MEPVNLMDLTLEETEKLVATLGEPRYRAKQVHKWVHQKAAGDFDRMTDLPAGFREKLRAISTTGKLAVLAVQKAGDGTAKYLFGLRDGQSVESVFLPHTYGNSVCVSSQVGCRMGCGFCASAIGGLVRCLTAGEMYAQVTGIGEDTGQRVSSIVIMGSGEPMDNLDQVLKFIHLIISPDGLNIGARHITVSTCGVVPGIRRLAGEKVQVTLSVSLHAPNDELRDSIMPVNRKYPVRELVEACRDYVSVTNRRVTFEYALIDGINDSREQAIELARLLKGMLCHVNLIPLNRVEERSFRQPGPGRVRVFKDTLDEMGIPVTVRREMGAGIDAACGQLRRKSAGGKAETAGR